MLKKKTIGGGSKYYTGTYIKLSFSVKCRTA